MNDSLLLGIDVGGTTIKFGVTDRKGTILAQNAVETNAAEGHDAVLGRIAAGGKALLDQFPEQVMSIGIGVPGVINARGEISYPPNFPGWGIVPVEERLRPLMNTSLPIGVENDANVAAFAEATIGSGTENPNFLFITLGTGVGGCVILDGKIWRGATGGAGEVGHLSVDMNGALCNCGARGCVEAYLGQRYLVALASHKSERFPDSIVTRRVSAGEELTPKLIAEAAQQGDTFAIEFFAEAGMILGAALSSMMNACDLHLAIVGGGLSRAGELILGPARRSMQGRLLKSIAHDADLRAATLHNDAGIVGAALFGHSIAEARQALPSAA